MKKTIGYLKWRKISQSAETDTFMTAVLGEIHQKISDVIVLPKWRSGYHDTSKATPPASSVNQG